MERPSDYIAKMNKTVMTRFNRFFLSEFFLCVQTYTKFVHL